MRHLVWGALAVAMGAGAASAAGPVVRNGNPAYAYPNPARPVAGETVTIRFPAMASASVSIYSLSGEIVAGVVSTDVQAGEGVASWSGRNGRGEPVASGVYLFVVSGPKTWVGKVTILN